MNRLRYGYLVPLAALLSFAQAALYAPSVWAQGEDSPQIPKGKGAVPRGFIVPKISPAPGGAKIEVDIYHNQKNWPVSTFLQMAVNDGKGNTDTITLLTLDDQLVDNKNGFRSHREYTVNYDDLNKLIKKHAGKGSKLQLVPGSPVYVYARWAEDPARGVTWEHQWGGPFRSGVVYLPVPSDQSPSSPIASAPAVAKGKAGRLKELDVAYPITQQMGNIYNTHPKKGLKVGGQVRSRLEAEGKFQLTESEFHQTRKSLFDLSNSPTEVEKLFGKGWTMQLESRYLTKDKKGNLVLDHNGVPIPDPMVDTYYDSATDDAAKNDMAFRYRWTQGNQTGAWNFKPGMGLTTPEGVVYRVEYGLDTMDDSPEGIAAFADSSDPINPFGAIQKVVPGAKASDFLNPAVKLVDYRFKFMLQHSSGLIIEVSADDVYAQTLKNTGSKNTHTRFFQLELDVDHLATGSTNTMHLPQFWMSGSGNSHKANPDDLKKYGKDAFVDGRPVIHSAEDLDPKSPIRQAKKADFDLATEAIVALRDHVLGKGARPGAQKYAFASYLLRHAADSKAAPSQSVQSLLNLGKLTALSKIADCDAALK